MRILYSRDDGSEYIFVRPGAPVCPNNVHQEDESVKFSRREEAASLLRGLNHDGATLSALRSLLPAGASFARLTPNAALRRVAELLWCGAVVVHRRRYARTAYFLETARDSPAPAVPHTPRPTVIEELDTFAPTHDAAAQANALKAAALAGVPFCEECEKARQGR